MGKSFMANVSLFFAGSTRRKRCTMMADTMAITTIRIIISTRMI